MERTIAHERRFAKRLPITPAGSDEISVRKRPTYRIVVSDLLARRAIWFGGEDARLNIAYLLKESFGQLCSYRHEAWRRCFFDNWRASLKWQRLKPYKRFAGTIEQHWDGIAPSANPRTRSPSASLKASTTKSASPGAIAC
jgi:hypothetical protein